MLIEAKHNEQRDALCEIIWQDNFTPCRSLHASLTPIIFILSIQAFVKKVVQAMLIRSQEYTCIVYSYELIII